MKAIIHIGFWMIGLTIPLTSVQSQSRKPKIKHFQHSVQAHESIGSIAKKYGIRAADIRSNNSSTDQEKPSILKIPLEVRRHGFRPQRGKYLLHRVQPKDNLHIIARRYRTSLSQLIRLNNFRTGEIEANQLVLVPNSPKIKKNDMHGYAAFGFSAATDYEGNTLANYSINGRYSFRQTIQKPPYQIITDFRTALGFRHQFSKRFYKNIDRIELRNKTERAINEKYSAFINTRFRSQLLSRYYYPLEGPRRVVSSPFAPSYTNISAGITFYNDILNIDFSVLDFRLTTVLNEGIFDHRKRAYGIERGNKMKAEWGISMQSDLYFYRDRKVELRADLHTFVNPKNLVLDLRGNLAYQVNKVMKITVILEVYRDKDFADHVQFRQEILTGFSFRK